MLYTTCWWCGKRIPYGKSRCEKCEQDYAEIKARRETKKPTKTQIQKFRSSSAWQKKRDYIMEKYNWLCQECLENGKLTPAEQVHHIVPLSQDFSLRLDDDNLIPLCHECHERKRIKEETINEYLL